MHVGARTQVSRVRRAVHANTMRYRFFSLFYMHARMHVLFLGLRGHGIECSMHAATGTVPGLRYYRPVIIHLKCYRVIIRFFEFILCLFCANIRSISSLIIRSDTTTKTK